VGATRPCYEKFTGFNGAREKGRLDFRLWTFDRGGKSVTKIGARKMVRPPKRTLNQLVVGLRRENSESIRLKKEVVIAWDSWVAEKGCADRVRRNFISLL